MSSTAIVALVLLSALVGLLVGWICGRNEGRDAQWVDDFIDAGRRERERRDAQGRFRKQSSQN